MNQLILAGNRINLGQNAGAELLTNPGFGHLQIVYGAAELEVQAEERLNPLRGDWVFEPIRDHTNPQHTYNAGVDGWYAATALDVGNRNPADVWSILLQFHDTFLDPNSQFSLFYDHNFNSNTYINSLLYAVGINFSEYEGAVTPADIVVTTTPTPDPYNPNPEPIETVFDMGLGFPGSDSNLMTGNVPLTVRLRHQELAPPFDIKGTASDDIVRTGGADDILTGFVGDDTLNGNGGNDVLNGGAGEDVLLGGSGLDTATYHHIEDVQENSGEGPSKGIVARISEFTFLAEDGYGSTDVLDSIEYIYGSAFDDTFVLSGELGVFSSNLVAIHGDSFDGSGDHGPVGDTLILDLAQSAFLDLDVGVLDTATGTIALSGLTNIVGTSQSDEILADASNNDLAGGGGADQIDGGAGKDFIYFASGGGAVSVNFSTGTGTGRHAEGDTYTDIEGVVGTSHDDTFVSASDGGVEYFAGGGGNDTFTIKNAPEMVPFGPEGPPDPGTAVIWGGSGADVIRIEGQTRLMVVNVDGLIEDNFHTFKLDNLGLGQSFDWTLIDAVIINPDAGDRVFYGGFGPEILFGPPDVGGGPGSFGFYKLTAPSFGSVTTEIITSSVEVDPEVVVEEVTVSFGGGFDFYNQSFLDGFNGTIFTRGAKDEVLVLVEYVDETGPDRFPDDWNEDYAPTRAVHVVDSLDGERKYHVFAAYSLKGTGAANPSGDEPPLLTLNRFDRTSFDSPPGFFIAGGGMSGAVISGNGAISITMDDTGAGFASLVDEAFTNGGGIPVPAPSRLGSVDGTNANDVINVVYLDPEGEGAGASDDILNGGAGNDTIFGEDGNDVIYGGAGDDAIYDGNGNDASYGDGGDDQFFASVGADHYDGGTGTDELSYASSTTGLIIDMLDAANSTGDAAGDTSNSIERVLGTGFADVIRLSANVSGFGGGGDDVIHDGAGLEHLSGGLGSDTFVLQAGDGAEDIIADFEVASDNIDLSAWGVRWFDQLMITAKPTSAAGFVDMQVSYSGESLALLALSDADAAALSADDFVFESAGPDLFGSSGNDRIDHRFTDLNGNGVVDVGQRIFGDGGADRIFDGAGDDVIYGGAGRDTFLAGAGSDIFIGGLDGANVTYVRSTSGLTIDMTDPSNSTGDAFGDEFSDIIDMSGSNFNDIIYLADGVRGFGGEGDDIIHDAGGLESMTGHGGADTFVFGVGDGQVDLISGYEEGVDLIDLSAWGVTDFSEFTIVHRNIKPDGGRHVDISFGDEALRILSISQEDAANIGGEDFLFAIV